MVHAFLGRADTLPPEWLPCNGQILPTGDYSQLFTVVGRRFTHQDDSPTDFRLPDYRGMLALHFDVIGGIRTSVSLVLPGHDIPESLVSQVIWVIKATD